MTAEELRTALRKRPFAPIRLHLSDGSSYDVRRPEMVLLTRHRAHVGVPADAKGLPRRAEIIDLIYISRMEELPAKKSSKD